MESGIQKLDWVRAHMPLMAALEERFVADGTFAGKKVAFSSHLEAKVARTIEALSNSGAEVLVVASNPATTQPDVLEQIRAMRNVKLFAQAGEGETQRVPNITAALAEDPDVCVDDGATLSAQIPDAGLPGGGGVCEQTTSGLYALRKRSTLDFPVYAVNDTTMKSLFDNRHGTGESTLSNILSMGNIQLAGKSLAVVGFGRCGAGIATKAQALGAQVLVVEIEPRRALAAHLQGMQVMPLARALAQADLVITATGEPDAITEPDFRHLRNGAMLANVGHFADEIQTAPLLRRSQEPEYRGINRCSMEDGRQIFLLSSGEAVNLAGSLAMGHPVEIIDITMGLLVLAAADMIEHRSELSGGVHELPDRVDLTLAEMKLAALGIELHGGAG